MKKTNNRRNFIKKAGTIAGASLTGFPNLSFSTMNTNTVKKSIKIAKVGSEFEREPLIRPYGFKGGLITKVWQVVNYLESDSGIHKIGLGTQSVLWSDSRVFAKYTENGGNALMYAMTEYALQLIKGQSFTSPVELLDSILDEVYAYGKKITGVSELYKTFALNSLVGVDNAAWLLYAAENNITNFDDMIPEDFRPALSHKHEKVASIPSFGYAATMDELKDMAEKGYFIMKIKLGHPGSQAEMLEKDMEFLTNIHKTIGHYETPITKSGKMPYYFDPNGRYEKKETFLKLLDHAKKLGMFEQIAVIEEPFPNENEDRVDDMGIIVAADESAHTEEDAKIRIEQGYGAIVLKAIAKTLSMTMKIAQLAHENNVRCFCADLTVNPILLDWNKNVAARLAPLGVMDIGLQEANGHQNYTNWDKMKTYSPANGKSWTIAKDGVFPTGKEFYKQSGGIFMPSPHYEEMFKLNR
ncbi:mandelate racemase/muconate lactonizing enzyme family protein [Flexithrix dorotheae]|uniref:mandelate racemase/muconate lactonizing enzyme family protein n=1 Tax=Flexithrix dorotheae TaxID=70993 RepID=UPI00039E2E35|nr:mandelate racemase/muconate lactonizing enzyme family protein [Flexithrix dorotheae]